MICKATAASSFGSLLITHSHTMYVRSHDILLQQGYNVFYTCIQIYIRKKYSQYSAKNCKHMPHAAGPRLFKYIINPWTNCSLFVSACTMKNFSC
jgi:hypothetical protein